MKSTEWLLRDKVRDLKKEVEYLVDVLVTANEVIRAKNEEIVALTLEQKLRR